MQGSRLLCVPQRHLLEAPLSSVSPPRAGTAACLPPGEGLGSTSQMFTWLHHQSPARAVCRGLCHHGPDCNFLHRVPTAADEARGPVMQLCMLQSLLHVAVRPTLSNETGL